MRRSSCTSRLAPGLLAHSQTRYGLVPQYGTSAVRQGNRGNYNSWRPIVTKLSYALQEICKKFARNLQVFCNELARHPTDFPLSFYDAITAMLRQIKQSSCIVHITYFQDVLGTCKWCCTPKTVL